MDGIVESMPPPEGSRCHLHSDRVVLTTHACLKNKKQYVLLSVELKERRAAGGSSKQRSSKKARKIEN